MAYPTICDLHGLRHDLAQWYASDAAARVSSTLAEAESETGRQLAARHHA